MHMYISVTTEYVLNLATGSIHILRLIELPHWRYNTEIPSLWLIRFNIEPLMSYSLLLPLYSLKFSSNKMKHWTVEKHTF